MKLVYFSHTSVVAVDDDFELTKENCDVLKARVLEYKSHPSLHKSTSAVVVRACTIDTILALSNEVGTAIETSIRRSLELKEQDK